MKRGSQENFLRAFLLPNFAGLNYNDNTWVFNVA